ncbi:MAG: phytanoyl-CoA dioxygenase family protein [Pseudomonadota bacterium]
MTKRDADRYAPMTPAFMSEGAFPNDEDAGRLRRDGFLLKDFRFAESDLAAAADATRAIGAAGHIRAQDLWRRDQAVRRIASHPPLLQFLSRLYGRRAFPFQTLNFVRGSQQKPHSDTMHFSSEPAHFMCGVWVALEDVSPESGPLVYYRGSQNLPIFDLRDLPGSDYAAHYEPHIQAALDENGYAPAHATPKRGEAFIWAANLVHGGSEIRNETLTRLSQVTHYYFDACVYTTPMRATTTRAHIRSIFDISRGAHVRQVRNGRNVFAGPLTMAASRWRNLRRKALYS